VNRRLLAVIVLGLCPWAVVTYPDGFYTVFSLGWVDGRSVTTLAALFSAQGSRPDWFLAWPVATLCWAAGVVAVAARARNEVVAALLALAGLSVLQFSISVSAQRGVLALPIGTIILGGAAVYWYGR